MTLATPSQWTVWGMRMSPAPLARTSPRPTAYHTTGGSAFVAKLNTDGSDLAYSTYLPGYDTTGEGVVVDEAGHAYVTGYTLDGYPVTDGAFQMAPGGDHYDSDAFVTELERIRAQPGVFHLSGRQRRGPCV